MNEINNLGNFNTIEEVWNKHPNGGKEGDYLFCDGLKYAWNKFLRMWDLISYIITTPSRKADVVDGDLIVNNNLVVGGTLRAKHVKQPNCGLFSSVESLIRKYPNPEVGMWATVGNTVPAPIYRCDVPGVWTPTGEMGGLDAMDWDRMEKAENDIIDLSETPIFSLVGDVKGDRYTPQFSIYSPNKKLWIRSTVPPLLQTKTFLVEQEDGSQMTVLAVDVDAIQFFITSHVSQSGANAGTKELDVEKTFCNYGMGIFVKFSEANTFDGASIKMGEEVLQLMLNGKPVTEQNSWKAGETVRIVPVFERLSSGSANTYAEVIRLNDASELEEKIEGLQNEIASIKEMIAMYHPEEYVIEYGAITASLTYSRANNTEGAQSIPTLTYSQERYKVYASGNRVAMSPVKSGAEFDFHFQDYEGNDVKFASDGILEWKANEGAIRHVSVELTITMNGFEKTVRAVASQAAVSVTSTYEYRNLQATLRYGKVSKDGGTSNPIVSYTQEKWKVYSNGEEELEETINGGAELSYRLGNAVDGAELGGTGVVTWQKNNITSERSVNVIVTVSLNGLDVEASGACIQNAASLKAYYGASSAVPSSVDMTNVKELTSATVEVSIKTESADKKKVHWIAVPAGYTLTRVLDVDNDNITHVWDHVTIDGFTLYYYNAGIYYSNTSKITISKT